jgi:microcystin-dependent protein
MSSPFVGEIRCFGFNFAPANWAFCNGALISIAQNATLFNLIGTTYGGDGVNTFGLPDLRGRVPMHQGNALGINSVMGTLQGTETVTLLTGQIPAHTHLITSTIVAPGGINEHVATPTTSTFIGPSAPDQVYNGSPTINAQFASSAIGSTGASQPHENRQPLLVLNFCISLFGIYPSQS